MCVSEWRKKKKPETSILKFPFGRIGNSNKWIVYSFSEHIYNEKLLDILLICTFIEWNDMKIEAKHAQQDEMEMRERI